MSHWYPHTIGTKHDMRWYWIIHPLFPEVFTHGEPNEEDSDWNTVDLWNGPFDNANLALNNMGRLNGNPGSSSIPHRDNSLLPEKLMEQMTKENKYQRYGYV